MNVTIIGLGLIGGSLGLALRAADADIQVIGWDRTAQTIDAALDRGAIDAGFVALADAVSRADVVVVATPVLAMREVLTAIAPDLKPGAIVTDVASTKADVTHWARELLPAPELFIGGHPMAGSERSGITHARADLFRHAVYCLTPASDTPPHVLATLERLVHLIGARPLQIDPLLHDSSVAAVSHLPFMLSAALVQHTAADERWEMMRRLAATGYRDVTRLASGDPVMHRDICLTNAAALRQELKEFAGLLDKLADHLDDPSFLDEFFLTTKQQRDAWLREREAR